MTWPTTGLIRIFKALGGDPEVGEVILVDPNQFSLDASDPTPTIVGVLDAAQGGIAAGALEDWHEIGASSEPGFQNSWVNFGGVEATAAFRKLPTGLVILKGLVKNGSIGATVFTLPVGYRPATNILFATDTNPHVSAPLNISSTGAVHHINGSNVFVSFNVSFIAEE